MNSSKEGLSQDEAQRRLQENGPNQLKEHKKDSLFMIFLKQFKDPLIYILLIAAIFTVIVKEYIDCAVIMAIIIINAIVGFIQEYKAEKALQAIKKLASPKTIVIRDGEEKEIDASTIVRGDIVRLRTGDRVPADMRLIDETDLEVNESTFTGESEASSKKAERIEKKNVPVAEQNNMAFMGTVITHGKAIGIVVGTGQKTELGKISKQVRETEKEKTPLQKRLMFFSKVIGIAILLLCGVILGVGALQGKSIKEMILFSISLAVGAIPEGLPIVITITMAIGIKRLAEHKAIIRKMIAVETLGSCDYICSDKTGTITENSMTVVKAYSTDGVFTFDGVGYEPEGEIKKDDKKIEEDASLRRLLRCGVLCNESRLYKDNENNWKIEGDPTEGALLVSAAKFGIERNKIQEAAELVDELPFKSKRQFMATLRKYEGKTILYVKGAPEKIFAFCGKEDSEENKRFNDELAEEGLRVLAFAEKELHESGGNSIDLEKEAQSGLEFLGVQAIIDPPRESVIEAIKQTKQAGITPVMITGDQKTTAVAIAQKVGIIEDADKDEAMSGQELDEKDESFLAEHVEKIRVYARVSPQHKFRIVEALQNKKHVVAVTGDGVNDAPALKKSNIGVAMGGKGTEVAKEAAEMILKDDNFATIFEAVKGGRVIYENIRKVIYFLLSPPVGVVLFILATLILKMPLPFLASQILWINLVTNGLQDVALAYEPGEANMAKKPPRNPKENIINRFVLKRLLLVGVTVFCGTFGIFWYKINSGAPLIEARTTAFTMVVFFQLFHVFNCRSFERSIFQISPFSNPFLMVSIVLSFGAQLAVLYYPPLQFVFKTTSLDGTTWIQIISISISIILIMEVDKIFIRRTS